MKATADAIAMTRDDDGNPIGAESGGRSMTARERAEAIVVKRAVGTGAAFEPDLHPEIEAAIREIAAAIEAAVAEDRATRTPSADAATARRRALEEAAAICDADLEGYERGARDAHTQGMYRGKGLAAASIRALAEKGE